MGLVYSYDFIVKRFILCTGLVKYTVKQFLKRFKAEATGTIQGSNCSDLTPVETTVTAESTLLWNQPL